MAIVEWNTTYSVGVEKLDKDHQILFALIDDLHEAMRVGKGSLVVDQIVKDLTDYTVYHFGAEESLMVRAGYPQLAAHRAEHQRFIKELEKIKHELAQGISGHAITVSDFLRDWLVNHIQKLDTRYSPHMKAKGFV